MNCKICGTEVNEIFSISAERVTNGPTENEEKNCPHFVCPNCGFVFHVMNDNKKEREIYNSEYWDSLDTGSEERLLAMMRLLGFVYNFKDLKKAKILDFGCGLGYAVNTFNQMPFALDIWGYDIVQYLNKRFISNISKSLRKFDIILACEVIEHFVDPVYSLELIWSKLNKGGIFIFETAYFHPEHCNESWWYLGPKNGHNSFYSVKTFAYLKNLLGVKESHSYMDYPGIQIWIKGE